MFPYFKCNTDFPSYMADSPAKNQFPTFIFFVVRIKSAQKPFALITSKNISYAGTVSASVNIEQVLDTFALSV